MTMQVAHLGDVLTGDNGASIFNWWNIRQWISINGRLYSKRFDNYHTQCGGNVVVIQPVTKLQIDEYGYEYIDRDLVNSLRNRKWNVDDLFVHGDCGITQVVMFNIHVDDVPMFHHWYQSMVNQFTTQGMGTIYPSEVIGVHYRTSDTVPIHWTFHSADHDKHDNGANDGDEGEYADHDRWCPECEYEYVNNDGYCSECGEYVLDECYSWEDYMSPAAECDDDSLSECKLDDYTINEDVFDTAERYSCDHPGYLNLHFDEYPSQGLVTCLSLSRYGGQRLCDRFTVFRTLFSAMAHMLSAQPVFMSSNMGQPYGETAWFIEQLQVRKDYILEQFGVEVTSPETYGTNPNMNYHYIDSLTLAVVNRQKFEEVVCQADA